MKQRTWRTVLVAAGAVLAAAALGWLAWTWYDSRLPGTYNVMDYGRLDGGGGPASASDVHRHHPGGASVASLVGPPGRPDVRFRLTARHARVRLPSGTAVDALTFDGRLPGPELRVHQADLVEVDLRNADVEEGVTIHWHGVDVPDAEDGVAGVTQDAVLPGGRYVYRFRAKQVGTFWYHTHQSSSEEVRRGLFGAFVIEPRRAPDRRALDLIVASHDVEGTQTLNGRDGLQRRAVAPGTRVRLRLVNTDNLPERFTLAGTPFRLVAVDGTDLNGPQPATGETLELAGGGRHDVAFTMLSHPVELDVENTPAALVLSPDGEGRPARAEPGPTLDLLRYGHPAPTPFGRSTRFDRRFVFKIGRKPGFLDGTPGMQRTINGGIYPDVPVFVVRRGELVAVTIANTTKAVHPMHLHGHHMLVLSRNGDPSTGSPWWSDTLSVRPGERYEVAFRADNPGIWMDHCHNLRHAAQGLTMHVAYAGFTTPYSVGGAQHNHPE